MMISCMRAYCVASVVSDSLQPHGLYPAKLLCPWDYPSKNTGVGCHFLLQEIVSTQGSNPCHLCWQVDSLPLSLQGNLISIIYVYLYLFNILKFDKEK